MNETATAPSSPFKGLAAFEDSELDALFFFGREREREVLVANLVASRLTVLYGESGVGKTSLLAAGVARELRALGPETVVSVHDNWSGGIEGVFDDVRGTDEAYVILDQFEEYFLYYDDDDRQGALLYELPELLRESRVNVLVSLREDALAQLDAFKARIPTVFANQVRLEHLDRDAARAAIVGPIGRWNELTGRSVEIEPALVGAVLDQVAVEGRLRDRDRIEAPYLQLVLERIWETELEAGSDLLRLDTLRALGGAGTIVRDHLLRALAGLAPGEQDVAANMFEHLVTPSGTKIAHRVADLAEYADVPEDALRPVLATLTRDRIVHSVDGSDQFEIFHDVLAEPIRAWRGQRRLERERTLSRRRHRRLLVLTASAFVALAIVAGLAVWAFSERSSAQSQARHARARALLATALQQLLVDPNQSVALAVEAAGVEAGPSVDPVLRQALVADRLRLLRHAHGPVRAVAVSPRGDLLAAAVAPGSVLLLDAENRRLVRTIGGAGAVAEVSFAPDGRTLVTASPTGVAHEWDVGSGRPLRRGPIAAGRGPDGRLLVIPLRGRLKRTIAHVQRLSVSPAEGFVAAAVSQRDGRVRPWIFSGDGRLLRVLPVKGVNDLTFSPDGEMLATVRANGTTLIWDPPTGKIVRELPDAKSGAEAVAFSPDGTLLATGGLDSGIRVWTVATGERTFFLFGHTNPISGLVWSPDGRALASTSQDKTVKLWRIRGQAGGGSLAATLVGNGAPVDSLAYSVDSTRLLTGGDDGTVRVWDARPDEQLDLLGRAPGFALQAQWAGQAIVGLWSSGVVKMFDARTRRLTHALKSRAGGNLLALGVSRDASVVAAGGAAGTTEVWNGVTGGRLPPQPGGPPVLSVAVAPMGNLVASGDSRGVVRVWRPESGRLLWTSRQSGGVADLAFSPSGDMLAAAGSRGTVLWSAAGGRRLGTLPSPDGDVKAAFSPDGTLVATAGVDGNGRLWFARTGDLYRVLRGHTAALTDIAFSGDGRVVAASGKDSDGWVWSVRKGLGHVLERLAFGPVASIALDSTGRWVAAAAPISAILWNAGTGGHLFYLRGHTDRLTGISFAPESPIVLTSSRDGTLRTYNCQLCVDLPALVHLARHRLAQTR
jgi:WD40 repeat protein